MFFGLHCAKKSFNGTWGCRSIQKTGQFLSHNIEIVILFQSPDQIFVLYLPKTAPFEPFIKISLYNLLLIDTRKQNCKWVTFSDHIDPMSL